MPHGDCGATVIEIIRQVMLPAAYGLLPSVMASPNATRMLMAIGWQESRFEHRTQLKNGPARGFWQFELGGGVIGVMAHHRSKPHAIAALEALQYPGGYPPHAIHSAIQHNDLLAAVFARLYLWTSPLPIATTEREAWQQYLGLWRPGKPHEASWSEAWRVASEP
jgi:hypothetical protein